MVSQTPEAPSAERRTAPSASNPRDRRTSQPRPEGPGWQWFLLVITLLMLAGALVFARVIVVPAKYLYKPGDNVGYYIGLVGGSMMLIMLLYSLRKRVKFMKSLSILPKWFRWHMILGIMGPALVMFHSTFVIHSINAGVALVCMLLVSGSGVFGRFFYTKIHNGLYGREITVKLMNENLAKTGSFKASFMSFAPNIDKSLEQFRVSTEAGSNGFWKFFTVGFKAASLSKSLVKELHQIMYTQAHEKHWDSGKTKHELDKLFEDYATHIRTYINTLRDAAQFRTYERLFSWWHIFHIPLVYMLVFSGIYHVIAVHMY